MSEIILKCVECTADFIVKHKSQIKRKFCGKRCSSICSNKVRKTGQYKQCGNCKKIIYIAEWQLKAHKQYCSTKCSYEGKSKKCRITIKCENSFCNTQINKTIKDPKRFCDLKCLNIYRSQKANLIHKFKNTKPELELKKILDENNIHYEFQKSLQWKRGWKKWYDFYIPNLNLLIEVDGIYWHGMNMNYVQLNNQQKQTRNNDILKNSLASIQGYNLERIWCKDISLENITKIIQKYDRITK